MDKHNIKLGYRIGPCLRKVDTATIERFKALPVATVSDAMARLFAGGPRLRPMHAGGQMLGPAFTVRTRPGDNLLVNKALDLAEAGDIIVVDAGGDLTNAIVGEIMTKYAQMRGIAGMVINGAIRDSEMLRANDFPVYAAGVTHRGPYKDGPGEINVPISLDGMAIEPGDLMIGDADGLLCVPYDDVDAVCRDAEAKQASEESILAAIHAGKSRDRGWIDVALQRLGYDTGGN